MGARVPGPFTLNVRLISRMDIYSDARVDAAISAFNEIEKPGGSRHGANRKLIGLGPSLLKLPQARARSIYRRPLRYQPLATLSSIGSPNLTGATHTSVSNASPCWVRADCDDGT